MKVISVNTRLCNKVIMYVSHATYRCWPCLFADTQLYKRLCPSIGPSVGPSVRDDLIENCENAHFRPCPLVITSSTAHDFFALEKNEDEKEKRDE